MNPSSNETLSGPLPTATPEQVPGSVVMSEAGVKPVEQGPATPETYSASKAPAMAAPPILPLPPLAAPAAPTTPLEPASQDDSAAPTTSVLPTADDDLIEKEWVNKAKAIVERNRDDPYKQSEELTAVKADYMQKHYNKTIKLNK